MVCKWMGMRVRSDVLLGDDLEAENKIAIEVESEIESEIGLQRDDGGGYSCEQVERVSGFEAARDFP